MWGILAYARLVTLAGICCDARVALSARRRGFKLTVRRIEALKEAIEWLEKVIQAYTANTTREIMHEAFAGTLKDLRFYQQATGEIRVDIIRLIRIQQTLEAVRDGDEVGTDDFEMAETVLHKLTVFAIDLSRQDQISFAFLA